MEWSGCIVQLVVLQLVCIVLKCVDKNVQLVSAALRYAVW